jgi:hypothetical protein
MFVPLVEAAKGDLLSKADSEDLVSIRVLRWIAGQLELLLLKAKSKRRYHHSTIQI